MKKRYEEPEMEVIRYNTEDVIQTSTSHHCGVGAVTGYDYEDANGNGQCEDEENFHCGGETGDYACSGEDDQEGT